MNTATTYSSIWVERVAIFLFPNNDDGKTVTDPHHYLNDTCIIDDGSQQLYLSSQYELSTNKLHWFNVAGPIGTHYILSCICTLRFWLLIRATHFDLNFNCYIPNELCNNFVDPNMILDEQQLFTFIHFQIDNINLQNPSWMLIRCSYIIFTVCILHTLFTFSPQYISNDDDLKWKRQQII